MDIRPQPPHMTSQHTTVLLHEAIDALVTSSDGVYLDGTYGRGGHSRLLLTRLSSQGRVLALDRDLQAVTAATGGVCALNDARFSIHHTNFACVTATLSTLGVHKVHGLLLDLGVSSPQIDDPARGFSFRFDGPLDMRMDATRGESAADFLARADVQQLTEVIRDYGEERFAAQVARALVARRESGKPIQTTGDLVKVVAGAVKTREAGQNPATRTFQALRIFVNAELDELERILHASLDLLLPGGRLVVISFHSLEDRIVKTFIARESKHVFDRRAPFAEPQAMRLQGIARIKPSAQEVQMNPRARSAVMRVAERTVEHVEGVA
jgi:16S rRNA (cytosine1402-N4)-methyltransferase